VSHLHPRAERERARERECMYTHMYIHSVGVEWIVALKTHELKEPSRTLVDKMWSQNSMMQMERCTHEIPEFSKYDELNASSKCHELMSSPFA